MPPVRRRPLLLAGPSRAAGLSRRHARVLLGTLVVLTLLVMAAAMRMMLPGIDPTLVDGIVDGIRHGGRFYDVATTLVRQAGSPLDAHTVPLPALAVTTGAMPLAGAIAMSWVLATAVVVAWWERLPPSVGGGFGRVIGAALIAVGVTGVAWPTLVAEPEAWAGLLVALSLARWRPDAPVEAAALGLAAAVIAPGAITYLAVMAIGALAGRHARETTIWALAALVAVAVLVCHGHALAASAVPPADMSAGEIDPGTLAAPPLAAGGALILLVAMLLVPAVAGWVAWPMPVAHRVLATIAAAVLLMLARERDTDLATGLLALPLLLLGLLALPDLVGDLLASARDRRRITVTRLAP